jgi:N-acetylglucosamine-6-phosphate deacetylase
VSAYPGFVDLQCNGLVGVDFSADDLTPDQIRTVVRELYARGTAGLLPTIITSSQDVYERNLSLIAEVAHRQDREHGSKHEARILGVHLEGPFISAEEGAVGAHDPESVIEPSVAFLEKAHAASGGLVKMLTVAADVPGISTLIRGARSLGIVVSLGHHLASAAQIQDASHAGARALTHLGNGLPHCIDRHQNPLWHSLANDDLVAMLITDGHHIPDDFIDIAFRCKGAERIVVVSDAAPVAALAPGNHRALGHDVILDETGRLYNPETGYLVGSASTMIECMNHLAQLDILETHRLHNVGFKNALDLIGVTADARLAEPMLRLDEQRLRYEPAV